MVPAFRPLSVFAPEVGPGCRVLLDWNGRGRADGASYDRRIGLVIGTDRL